MKNPKYSINEEMLEWVHREYNEDFFLQFLGELYVRAFKILTNHRIISVIFYWVFQPLESRYSTPAHRHKTEYDEMKNKGKPRSLSFKPKIVNVKNL